MDIKILKVYEQNNTLNVVVESPYGEDRFGLGLNKKYLDPETDQPKWLTEVKRLLEDKYGNVTKRKKVDVIEAKKFLNKTMKLADLPDKNKIKPLIKNVESN